MKDIFSVVADLIAETFLCPASAVSRDTSAADIDGWDSLSHAILMLRFEREFGVRFTAEEAHEPDNVGELVDMISRKLAESKS